MDDERFLHFEGESYRFMEDGNLLVFRRAPITKEIETGFPERNNLRMVEVSPELGELDAFSGFMWVNANARIDFFMVARELCHTRR